MHEVAMHLHEFFPNGGYNISGMVPARVIWEGDIMNDRALPGLSAWGHRNAVSGSWRTHMKTPACWTGISAKMLLREVLNPNSYADLESLLEHYPDHVIELSALAVNFGTVPHRYAIICEVR
jgi:hypothetical protein